MNKQLKNRKDWKFHSRTVLESSGTHLFRLETLQFEENGFLAEMVKKL